MLDHDSPSNAACTLALGGAAPTCGDITAFSINQTTGRLSLVVNAQVSSASGAALPYFPVPANPIDFTLASGYLLTLSGTPATGDATFPYTYNSSSGQLTINQNTSQPLGIYQGTAIVNGTGYVYVLDNEATLVSGSGASGEILPFSVASGGALQAQTGGAVPDDPTLANPNYLLVESKGKFLYVANQGNNVQGTNAAERPCRLCDRPHHSPAELHRRRAVGHRRRAAMPGRRSLRPVHLHGKLQRFHRNRARG